MRVVSIVMHAVSNLGRDPNAYIRANGSRIVGMISDARHDWVSAFSSPWVTKGHTLSTPSGEYLWIERTVESTDDVS